jgi:hypothetical protein
VRRAAAALGAVLVVLSLTGCVQLVTAAAPADPDEAFLTEIRAELPQYAAAADSLLIEIAHNACAVFDDGYDLEDIYVAADSSGIPADDIDVILDAGVAAYCPEYGTEIR